MAEVNENAENCERFSCGSDAIQRPRVRFPISDIDPAAEVIAGPLWTDLTFSRRVQHGFTILSTDPDMHSTPGQGDRYGIDTLFDESSVLGELLPYVGQFLVIPHCFDHFTDALEPFECTAELTADGQIKVHISPVKTCLEISCFLDAMGKDRHRATAPTQAAPEL